MSSIFYPLQEKEKEREKEIVKILADKILTAHLEESGNKEELPIQGNFFELKKQKTLCVNGNFPL